MRSTSSLFRMMSVIDTGSHISSCTNRARFSTGASCEETWLSSAQHFAMHQPLAHAQCLGCVLTHFNIVEQHKKTPKANARASRASGNDACAQPAIGERSSTDSFWQRCQLLILSKYCARTSLWQCAVHGWLASNIQERCLRNSSPWPSLATGSDENAHLSVASIEQRCSRCSLVSVVEISKKERLRKSSNLEFWR